MSLIITILVILMAKGYMINDFNLVVAKCRRHFEVYCGECGKQIYNEHKPKFVANLLDGTPIYNTEINFLGCTHWFIADGQSMDNINWHRVVYPHIIDRVFRGR